MEEHEGEDGAEGDGEAAASPPPTPLLSCKDVTDKQSCETTSGCKWSSTKVEGEVQGHTRTEVAKAATGRGGEMGFPLLCQCEPGVKSQKRYPAPFLTRLMSEGCTRVPCLGVPLAHLGAHPKRRVALPLTRPI